MPRAKGGKKKGSSRRIGKKVERHGRVTPDPPPVLVIEKTTRKPKQKG